VNHVIRAIAFAADKHRNQRRKDAQASPYINHPIALADVLANEGHISDENVLMAAVLHDTLEDTDTSHEELLHAFGHEVAKIVSEVTDDKSLPKDERKRLQIEHAGHISHGAKLVKLADKICNVRDIVAMPPADWDLQRKLEYFDWSRRVVNELRGVHPLLEALYDAAYQEGLALDASRR
jgi:GTP diphosphokinase / guanosine-3',5'-bis(diphosphate) 3'-diphosphatase